MLRISVFRQVFACQFQDKIIHIDKMLSRHRCATDVMCYRLSTYAMCCRCDAWLCCCLVTVLSGFDRLNNRARAVVWSSIRSGRRLVWPTTNCTTCEDARVFHFLNSSWSSKELICWRTALNPEQIRLGERFVVRTWQNYYHMSARKQPTYV